MSQQNALSRLSVLCYFYHLEHPSPLGDRAVHPRSVHGTVVCAELIHPLPDLFVGNPSPAVDIIGCLGFVFIAEREAAGRGREGGGVGGGDGGGLTPLTVSAARCQCWHVIDECIEILCQYFGRLPPSNAPFRLGLSRCMYGFRAHVFSPAEDVVSSS